MLLLIDIGNTNTKIGLYEGHLKRVLNFRSVMEEIPLEDIAHAQRIDGAVISSVVPRLGGSIAKRLERHCHIRPLIVNHRIKSGLRYRIKRPERLGPDRIAMAAGARWLYKGDLIVIGFGTATTFSLINRRGEYIGGAIMPGLRISADVLAERTALLPRIRLRVPEHVIGRDTEENILTGLIIGHAGATERIIREMRQEAGLRRAVIIATGGLADLVVPYIKGVRYVNPHLALEGLRVLYELNVK
jgi:type III pantothenate kinase